jgi:hypothetical protein
LRRVHCPRCGHSNEAGDRFCSSCGAELPAADERPAETGPDAKADRPGRLRRLFGTTRRERWISAATVVAIVVAVIAFILLDTPEDDGSTDPFLQASDDRCVQAKAEIATVSRRTLGSGRPDAREDYVEGLFDIVVRWRSDQRSLQPSPGQRQAADAYLAALLDVSASLADLSDATGGGGAGRLTETAEDADAATAALEAQIDELGLDRCGALAFEPDAAG